MTAGSNDNSGWLATLDAMMDSNQSGESNWRFMIDGRCGDLALLYDDPQPGEVVMSHRARTLDAQSVPPHQPLPCGSCGVILDFHLLRAGSKLDARILQHQAMIRRRGERWQAIEVEESYGSEAAASDRLAEWLENDREDMIRLIFTSLASRFQTSRGRVDR